MIHMRPSYMPKHNANAERARALIREESRCTNCRHIVILNIVTFVMLGGLVAPASLISMFNTTEIEAIIIFIIMASASLLTGLILLPGQLRKIRNANLNDHCHI